MDNEISIFPFQFKHFELLIEMLEDRNYDQISAIKMKTLPKIGYIAMLNDQPIAAGFLRRVEGGFAQIDTLVSNSHFGSMVRHDGINKIVGSLIEDAKVLKLEGIIGFTGDSGILKRAKELGFKVIDQSLIALPLNKT